MFARGRAVHQEEVMAHVTTKWTTTMAALAVAALPALLDAQQSYPRTQRETRQPAATRDTNSPEYHLGEARRVLNGITVRQTPILELKRHFVQLERAYLASAASTTGSEGRKKGQTSGAGTGTTSGTTGTATPTTPQTGKPTTRTPGYGTADRTDWMTHYQAISESLKTLMASGDASGIAGDAATRTRLTEFRTHLDQFHTMAMEKRGNRPGEEDAASASAASGITGAMTGTSGSTETSGSTGTAGTTSTTAGTAGSAPVTFPGANLQTERPGTMFGTQQADSATIARITATLDEMLRGSASTSISAGTTPQATPGATGTSGTAAAATGTVCVDRAKLEQLRRDIDALRTRQ